MAEYVAAGVAIVAILGAAAGTYYAYQGAKANEAQLELEKDAERTRSKERAAQIREAKAAALAEQRAALASRGIDVGGPGVAQVLSSEVQAKANTDMIYNEAAWQGYRSANSLSRKAVRMGAFGALAGGVSSAAGTGYSYYSARSGIGTNPGTGSGSGDFGRTAGGARYTSPLATRTTGY